MDTYGILLVFISIVTIAAEPCPQVDNLPGKLMLNSTGPYVDLQIVSFQCKNDGEHLVGESYAVCTDGQLYFSQFPFCQDDCEESNCANKNGYCNDLEHCVCRPGYSSVSDVSDYQNCSKKTSVKTIITLDTNWRPDYSNKSSAHFMRIQADICSSFDKAFHNNDIGDSSIRCYVASLEEAADDDGIVAFVITDFFEAAAVTASKVQGIINSEANNEDCLCLPELSYELKSNAVSSDLNECEAQSSICAGDFALCNYTSGGNYECSCTPGTYKTDDFKVDGSDCDTESLKLGLVVGLGVVCGIALGFFLPAYIWFLISPAFGKNDFNTPNNDEESMEEEGTLEDENDEENDSFEDDELDKQLTMHEDVIQNMTNFNPMPAMNSSMELPSVNQMGNLHNQPSNVYYSR